MRSHWIHRLVTVVLCAAPLVSGCAETATIPVNVPLPAAAAPDGSPLCGGVLDRFVGLPAGLEAAGPSSGGAPAMAGRWWIRSCSARRTDFGLQLSLAGPGFYWIDSEQSGLRVRQQVPFSLSLKLDNRPEARVRDGVFSLWLSPVHEPRVELKLAESPRVHRSGAWGSMLGLVLPVQAMAADRISESATAALRAQLRRGVTVTYDVRSGQTDATLGRLADGATPSRPFPGDAGWAVNERLALAPGATQVVGPLDAGRAQLDVRVERGPGITYRAVCASDLNRHYPAIAAGRLHEVPARAFATTGTSEGPGEHAVTLRVEGCRYYLVVSTRGTEATIAALRVR